MSLKLGVKAPSMHKAPMSLRMYLKESSLPPLVTYTQWRYHLDQADHGNLGMFLNDQLGDCTCAGPAHNVMAVTANAGGMVTPTDAEVGTMYQQSGYVPGDESSDQGWTLLAAAQYMVSTGLAGIRADAFIEIDPKNLTYVKYALQLLGPCLNLGVNLPTSAMDAFQAANGGAVLWGDTTDTNILGGHDVAGLGYSDTGMRVGTWGSDQVVVTWEWFATYVTEVSAMIFPAFVTKGGKTPSGLDLDGMVADSKSLAQQ